MRKQRIMPHHIHLQLLETSWKHISNSNCVCMCVCVINEIISSDCFLFIMWFSFIQSFASVCEKFILCFSSHDSLCRKKKKFFLFKFAFKTKKIETKTKKKELKRYKTFLNGDGIKESAMKTKCIIMYMFQRFELIRF